MNINCKDNSKRFIDKIWGMWYAFWCIKYVLLCGKNLKMSNEHMLEKFHNDSWGEETDEKNRRFF